MPQLTGSEKISFGKAILLIVLSVFLVSGSAFLGWAYLVHVRQLRAADDNYKVVAVIQTGPEKEALKTVYLEELLGLSVDRPFNLYSLDTQEMEKVLLESPLIKKVSVKKIKPGTLYIDYSIRQPVAYIGDYTNTAIDADRTLIPFKPFFTPKKIPEIYLGLDLPTQRLWGESVSGDRIILAFKLLDEISQLFSSEMTYIRKIDVSKAYADSYGQRQVVVVIEDWFEREFEGRSILCICPRILRLSTAHYHRELEYFMVLKDYFRQQEMEQIVDDTLPVVKADPMTIDMRIPQLAFFKE